MQQLTQLTNQLEFLNHLLPPPLVNSWQKEQQVLGAAPDISLQLQVALAKLAKLAEFENRISLHEMPITSPQGADLMVKQLYLGTGIAWFVSANNQYSGWGQANDEGWTWHFDNQKHAAKIKSAIAIFEKKQQADFIELPFRLVDKTSSLSTLTPVQKSAGKA